MPYKNNVMYPQGMKCRDSIIPGLEFVCERAYKSMYMRRSILDYLYRNRFLYLLAKNRSKSRFPFESR